MSLREWVGALHALHLDAVLLLSSVYTRHSLVVAAEGCSNTSSIICSTQANSIVCNALQA